jgi:hypothetical protein
MKTTFEKVTLHSVNFAPLPDPEAHMLVKLASDIDARARSIKSSARACAEFFAKVVEKIEETDLDSAPVDLDRQALRDLARDTVMMEAQKTAFCAAFRAMIGKPFHKAAAEYKAEQEKIYAAVLPTRLGEPEDAFDRAPAPRSK